MTAVDYSTSADIKAYLPDMNWGTSTTYDALLVSLITAASRCLDRYTNRLPGAYAVSTASTAYFDAPGGAITVTYQDNRLGGGYAGDNGRLWIGELAAAPTSVAVSTTGSVTSYTAMASTDYLCGPWNALNEGKPYQWLQLDLINGDHATWYGFPKGVQVVGKFGYAATVPEDIKDVVIKQVVRWFKLAQAGFQTQGTVGNVVLDKMFIPNQLDPDFRDKITYLRRLAL